MKCSKQSFTGMFLSMAVLLSLSTFAAARTAKRQCMEACRAHYRDCRHLNHLPSFECRGIYQDCTQYSCTGLGPG
jgi:hypothetical protein